MKPFFATNTFQKDLKRAVKRDKKIKRLEDILDLLSAEDTLPAKTRPHKLSGQYAGLWECHIEPDWLLIYGLEEDEIILYRTGTHADLFE